MSTCPFKVGDKIVCGAFPDDYYAPVFSFGVSSMHLHPATKKNSLKINLVNGEISDIDDTDNTYRVKLLTPSGDLGGWAWFRFEAPPEDADGNVAKYWPRLGSAKAAELAPPPKPVWEERISVNRLQDVPDSVMAAAIDRGERGVRRNIRHWPDNTDLIHNVSRNKEDMSDFVLIQWYWQKKPD